MPIYEYRCPGCAKTFDVLQRVSDTPLKECPQCGGAVEKQLSVPIVVTKSKSQVVRRLLPEQGWPSALDGTRPLDWPRGRLVGVKSETAEKSQQVDSEVDTKRAGQKT